METKIIPKYFENYYNLSDVRRHCNKSIDEILETQKETFYVGVTHDLPNLMNKWQYKALIHMRKN